MTPQDIINSLTALLQPGARIRSAPLLTNLIDIVNLASGGSADPSVFQLKSEKNAANGYVGLDSSSKISIALMSLLLADSVTASNTTWSSTKISNAISTAIADLVASSPSTLDTLNELAAALGDDPNFATTITTLIGQKVAKSDKATQANYEASTADNWIDSALFGLILGQLSALDTQDQTSFANAINEVFSYLNDQAVFTASNFPASNNINLSGFGLVRNWLLVGGVGNASTSFTVTNKGEDGREIKGRMFLKKTISGNVTLTLSPGSVINSVVLTGAVNTWYYIEYRGIAQAATTDDFWISHVAGVGSSVSEISTSEDILTSSASVDLDMVSFMEKYAVLALAHNTTFSISNPGQNKIYVITVTTDSTARTLTLPANSVWTGNVSSLTLEASSKFNVAVRARNISGTWNYEWIINKFN
ncbi:hypothetical protein QNI19_14470 [Cytophagaceae bacterium DM2B3-1]|uniref:Uncharacterized protein n=1 Tax=Xanthocytophaga flava TaxID=3048013 RepID=A0ABT7CK74_9BACT|nr:hypothetical protein [Xanthocytophaga flavus]MDJ1494145.1 hypothetical protein [Xanthocytophaga flavus]